MTYKDLCALPPDTVLDYKEGCILTPVVLAHTKRDDHGRVTVRWTDGPGTKRVRPASLSRPPIGAESTIEIEVRPTLRPKGLEPFGELYVNDKMIWRFDSVADANLAAHNFASTLSPRRIHFAMRLPQV